MTILEAIIVGVIQGLTEFLPVSSSGHIELASAIFGIEGESNLHFTMVVHAATVLSTITIFAKELLRLFRGFFKFKINEETIYIVNIIISMLPIIVVGLLFKDKIEEFFTTDLTLVGSMLLVTAALLTISQYTKPKTGKITYKSALIIGLSQALAVLPGLSRSGTTIATGLMLGVKREEVAKFSFLMVLVPVIGVNLLELIQTPVTEIQMSAGVLIAGFVAAYITGVLACKLMIRLVSKGNLIWFAAYCALVGLAAILYSLLG